MEEKVLALAKKLKELADRGEGGEQVNAKTQLDKLLAKHGLVIEDLEIEIESHHVFCLRKNECVFFEQVASTVLGKNFSTYVHTGKKNTYSLLCNHLQAIEIQGKWDFYLPLYKKELAEMNKRFYTAFIFTQELFPKDAEPAKKSSLTKDELDEYAKVIGLSRSIEKKNYLKQIAPPIAPSL
jgi:hypothetical protein